MKVFRFFAFLVVALLALTGRERQQRQLVDGPAHGDGLPRKDLLAST